jgi:hypothetical protein
MRRTWALTLAGLLVSLTGCPSAPSGDGASPASAAFAPEAPERKAAVFMRGRVRGEQVIVQIVARGAKDVHGLAFRLTYDPGQLSFVEAAVTSAWSNQALTLAKEGLPGELAVVWSEKGAAHGVEADEDTVLGTLRFDMHGLRATPIAFRSERSSVRDSAGKELAVRFYGGEVVGR